MVDQKFLLTKYRLVIFCPPPLKPNVANTIDMCYGRLPLKIKAKFYTDQVQIEIRHFNISIGQGYCQMSNLEAKMKYIKTLEAKWAKQIQILKNVQIRDVTLCRKIKSQNNSLAQPLLLETKPEFGHDVDFGKIGKNNVVTIYITN